MHVPPVVPFSMWAIIMVTLIYLRLISLRARSITVRVHVRGSASSRPVAGMLKSVQIYLKSLIVVTVEGQKMFYASKLHSLHVHTLIVHHNI